MAGNPFEYTQRLPSEWVMKRGWIGTDNWEIIWYVCLMCAFFEFMDSAGGMGYGTVLPPILFSFGFDPKQVIPLIMITECYTGIMAGMIHREFANVEWQFFPFNETTKLVLLVTGIGAICVCFSLTAFYKILKLHKFWTKLYVTMLLGVMGVCSVMTAKSYRRYKPKMMVGFAAIAGFNKGIGGGGYGPVVTVGGLLSGIPVKSMVAITSFAEGFVCFFAVTMWFILLSTGLVIDYMLLPSYVIGTVVAAVGAPYVTRILPEKFWKICVPAYCCFLCIVCFWKLWPAFKKKFLGG